MSTERVVYWRGRRWLLRLEPIHRSILERLYDWWTKPWSPPNMRVSLTELLDPELGQKDTKRSNRVSTGRAPPKPPMVTWPAPAVVEVHEGRAGQRIVRPVEMPKRRIIRM